MKNPSTDLATFSNVYLKAWASSVPPEFLSSEFLERQLEQPYQKLNLQAGRLEMLSGVKERGFWPKQTRPSEIATDAVRKVLGHHPQMISQIDGLIYCGVTRDHWEPATAAHIHRSCELPSHTHFFDLSNACLGMLSGFLMAAAMVEQGIWRNAILCTGEHARPLLDDTITKLNQKDLSPRELRGLLKKHFAALTIGSAGICFLLGRDDGELQLVSARSQADSSQSELCHGGLGPEGVQMETHSEVMLVEGLKLAEKNFDGFLKESGRSRKDFSKFILHQVGSTHHQMSVERLGLGIDKVPTTFEQFGNTGSAAMPLTLTQCLEQNEIKSGELVACLGIGSGLESLIMEMKKC